MKFGVMDHLDLSGDGPIQTHYENRLRLLEIYDRAGFHGYHVTEHHCTPLGGGASPSVFLSAAAQRTKNLRLGTLVYALPAHHPIRLTEEIGMIDQMSGGRIDLGFGRGSVPMELAYFGVDPANAREIHEETLECVLQGLATGRIDFEGRHIRIKDAPIFQRPKQLPHPPLWYGVHSLESAERAAVRGYNIVCNEPGEESGGYIDMFKSVWARRNPDAPTPMTGLARFVYIGRTDDEANAVVRRAYLSFVKSFRWLHTKHGVVPRLSGREASFDELVATERGVAGSPETVANVLRSHMQRAGANYCVMRLAFGDMSWPEMESSVRLFVDEVMPLLSDA
jgi:alkanesulfonate monooxygenase SsuD/methylene tetrahydromethanopterin reductase-like flavin-dependent oxidoreductase (luciferase family)